MEFLAALKWRVSDIGSMILIKKSEDNPLVIHDHRSASALFPFV